MVILLNNAVPWEQQVSSEHLAPFSSHHSSSKHDLVCGKQFIGIISHILLHHVAGYGWTRAEDILSSVRR